MYKLIPTSDLMFYIYTSSYIKINRWVKLCLTRNSLTFSLCLNINNNILFEMFCKEVYKSTL